MSTNVKWNVSIIIPSKNEGINLFNTVKSIITSKTSIPYEIIIVEDGPKDNLFRDNIFRYYDKYLQKNKITITIINDNELGAARARQLGARHANGKYFLFCDAHVFVEDLWLDKLIQPLGKENLDAVCPSIAPHDKPHHCGYGQTWDSSFGIQWLPNTGKINIVPLLPGGCFIIKSNVFHKIRGFDEGFRLWGYEDGELSLKLWLMGYRIGVHPEVKVLHIFRKRFPYYVGFEHIYYNLLRMAYIHFNQKRIKKVLTILEKRINEQRELERIQRQVIKSEAFDLRNWFLSRRQYDDNWFFKTFKIPF